MSKIQQHVPFATIAVDLVLFTIKDSQLFARVMNVNRPPFFQNVTGFPGGLISPSETAEQSVARICLERGLVDSKKVHIEQLRTMSELERDPRSRVLSVAYLGLVPFEELSEVERLDTPETQWTLTKNLLGKKLAYDHTLILTLALERLASRLTYTTLAKALLPKLFTLSELEVVYTTILERNLDKRNFRKKILSLNILKATQSKKQTGPHRPAQLYQFKHKEIQIIETI
jgi:8-oxo-dGTP diphosphatase